MFLGIYIYIYLLGLLRANFNPRLTARAKICLIEAQNIFMPANINSIGLMFSWLFRCFLFFVNREYDRFLNQGMMASSEFFLKHAYNVNLRLWKLGNPKIDSNEHKGDVIIAIMRTTWVGVNEQGLKN